jgi:rod shape-determining protein MreC
VYDKTARRRRAVLVVLVALSLILLTAYFGEAPNGRLHSVQRDFLTVVSPIQDGASKAFKPVRNLFGWFGDALHAKSQRDALRKQLARVQSELIAREDDERGYHRLLQLYHLDTGLGIGAYRPVTAAVTGQSPNLWYLTVNINKGTSAGVQINDPVIDGEGLVGKVTAAVSDGAQVSLITDSSVAVSGMIASTGAPGLVQPKVGDPYTLVMQYLPANTPVSVGGYVATSGTISSHGESLFPRGIAIGRVSSVEEEGPYKTVEVTPLANLHGLETVQVLTDTQGSAPARASSVAAALPPGQSPGPAGAVGEESQLASTGSGN